MRHGEDNTFLEDLWWSGEQVDEIENRPDLDPWCEDLWRGYVHLARSRPVGMGIGSIPVSEVSAYLGLRYPHYSLDEQMHFLDLIAAMDAHYMKVQRELHPDLFGDNSSPRPGSGLGSMD